MFLTSTPPGKVAMRGRALPCLGLGLALAEGLDAGGFDALREAASLADFAALSAAFAEAVSGFGELGVDRAGFSAGASPTETVRLADSLPVSGWGGSVPPLAPVPWGRGTRKSGDFAGVDRSADPIISYHPPEDRTTPPRLIVRRHPTVTPVKARSRQGEPTLWTRKLDHA